MRVLISGDIHIGRRSSKIPENATGFRARDAWMKIVETAIKERVDLVLLSGDVADRDNRFWEAIGPLEAGTIGQLENRCTTSVKSACRY